MDEKNKTDQYIGHINSHILPFIDYHKLQESYGTDMVYAKGILNRLHEAMVSVYGDIQLDESDGDDGFVIIPGVVRGRESGNVCIALLELDVSSSGEHWGTSYLCKYGVISQSGGGEFAHNNNKLKAETKEINATYLPYDYAYTAVIPDDIHVEKSRLPEEIKSVLTDFRRHRAELLSENNSHEPKYFMDERDFENKLAALLPGSNPESIKAFINYAKELEADDPANSPSELYKEVYVEFNLITRHHGKEISLKVLDVCDIDILNSFELRGAANYLHAGVTPEKVSQMASDGQCHRTDREVQEFRTAMEGFENGAFDKSAVAEKPSVLDRIREVENEPKPSRKGKSTKNKNEPEH